jgi:RNAse (barnase) inhibitor barstar
VLVVTVEYVIDGERIGSLEDFWAVVGAALGADGYFGTNLDAFADCLRGGYGTPDDGDFTVQWRASGHSRSALGYPETVRQLQLRLRRADPSHRESISAQLEAAREGRGPTVFDWLVKIFETEIPGRLRLT